MNGFLNILKPPGMTSAAVVAVLRRLTGEKRVGHAGTLDPEAAGVLPVMIGRATRLFDYLVDKEKTYVAEVAFGAATDTEDATGTVTETGENYPTLPEAQAAAEKLTGEIEQRPSMFSAIKKDGKPLYVLAHQGKSVEVPVRRVRVESIRLSAVTPNHGMLMTVRCGRGTYIRSLCADLGRLTGCPAHMRFLLRAQSGAFGLDTAITLEEAAEYAAQGTLAEHLLPLDMPLGHIPAVVMPDNLLKKVENGVRLPLCGREDIPEGTAVRVYCGNRFYGMALRETDGFSWRAVIPPEE